MKRVILLSGLTVLARPAHLYTLARIVRPDLLPNFYEFGYRYCDPRQSFEGIDFSNAGNLTELRQLLDKRLYSSHKRKHIYQDLSEKMYQKLEITADVNIVVKIQHLLKTFIQPWEDEQTKQHGSEHRGFFFDMFFKYFCAESLKADPGLIKFLTLPIDEGTPSFQKTLKQIFRDLFDLTGQAKVKAVLEVIDNLLF